MGVTTKLDAIFAIRELRQEPEDVRACATLSLICNTVQIATGIFLMANAEGGPATIGAGAFLFVRGVDGAIADIETIRTGEVTPTLSQRLLEEGAKYLTSDPDTQKKIAVSGEMALTVVEMAVALKVKLPPLKPGSAFAVAGRTLTAGRGARSVRVGMRALDSVELTAGQAKRLADSAKVTIAGNKGLRLIFLMAESTEGDSSNQPGNSSSAPKRTRGPYSHLDGTDRTKIEPGKEFTDTQTPKIREENMRRNGGKLMSDDPRDPLFGQELVPPPKGPFKPGNYPDVPDNQAQVDHIIPKIGPDGKPLGTNAYSNAQVTSAFYNRMKSNKLGN